jgi:anti-sigma factor RsiW
MNDRVRPRHAELEELAQLVEGTLELERAAAVRRHVAACPSCLAAYEEAVRDRATWLGDPDQFALPSEFQRAHAQVLGRVEDERATKAVRPIPIPPIRTRTRWAWAAAATAAGLAAILWLGIPPMSRQSDRLALPPAIRAAAEDASARGLVLPGGEAGANTTPAAFRSGEGPDVGPEISRALARYEHDRDSAALHAACIGLVANRKFDNARDYIEEGLKHDAKDVVLQVLAADLAYRDSKLGEAAQRLRTALDLRPHDPVTTLDLGIVLAETGDTAEAKRLLQSVAKEHRGTSLGDRAAREISALPKQGS